MFICSYKAGIDYARVHGSINIEGVNDETEATTEALKNLQEQFRPCGYWVQITNVEKI